MEVRLVFLVLGARVRAWTREVQAFEAKKYFSELGALAELVALAVAAAQSWIRGVCSAEAA